ncbi:MAG: NINE protein [Saprospiraceae bacterium]
MQPKSRIKAALLAFFTGWMGGHQLYLGKIGAFIGFMFMFIMSVNIGIPLSFIIGIIQGIRLLQMSDQDFNRKYNRAFAMTYTGPLERRREEQMRRFEQIPQKKATPIAQNKANPYKQSGIKKYKDFDLDDAILDFSKGLEISPNDIALHFNIACAYSLTEQKEKSFYHLSRAVSLGLNGEERILTHDDLAYLRIQPEFDAFKKSGFKVLPAFSAKAASSEANNWAPKTDMNDGLLKQLDKLQELKSKGALTEEEFQFERKKILRQ